MSITSRLWGQHRLKLTVCSEEAGDNLEQAKGESSKHFIYGLDDSLSDEAYTRMVVDILTRFVRTDTFRSGDALEKMPVGKEITAAQARERFRKIRKLRLSSQNIIYKCAVCLLGQEVMTSLTQNPHGFPAYCRQLQEHASQLKLQTNPDDLMGAAETLGKLAGVAVLFTDGRSEFDYRLIEDSVRFERLCPFHANVGRKIIWGVQYIY